MEGDGDFETACEARNRQRRWSANRCQFTGLGRDMGGRGLCSRRPAVFRHLALLLARALGQPQAGHSPECGLKLEEQQESGEDGLHAGNGIPF